MSPEMSSGGGPTAGGIIAASLSIGWPQWGVQFDNLMRQVLPDEPEALVAHLWAHEPSVAHRLFVDERKRTCFSRAPPWAEVGAVLVDGVWRALSTSLERCRVKVKERVKRYRWTNEMGGGDYSTGITDTPDEHNSVTWVEEWREVWRALDERTLTPEIFE